MKEVKQTNKLVVVTDNAGKILSAMWPGTSSEGAPSEIRISLSEGQVSYELEVPNELHESARPDLSDYHLQTENGGPAALVKRSKK